MNPPPSPKAPPAPTIPDYANPSLTYGVVSVLALVYFLELLFPIGGVFQFQPSGETMIAFGALEKKIIANTHEWYRVFTAPFVNGAIIPLVCNIINILIIGPDFERLLGRLWFCATFFLSAVCGSLMAYALNDQMTIAVGTAGTIDGLFAALYIFSFELNGDSRTRLQLRILCGVLLCLIPLSNGIHKGLHIFNYGAHFGGTLAGAVIGILLLCLWPAGPRIPPLRGAALTITAIGSFLLAVSVPLVVIHYSQYEKLLWLIPPEQMSLVDNDTVAQSANLIAVWPHDPRGHLLRSVEFYNQKNLEGTRRELETALSAAQDLHFIFGDDYEAVLRNKLVRVLAEGNHLDEIGKFVDPRCRIKKGDHITKALIEDYKAKHLCGF